MNQPRRFKAARNLKLEGRLVALASVEVPDPDAKQRAARRLGISAAAMASAAAASAVATNVSAAAATSGSGAATSLTTLGHTTTSFIAATVAKATVIGLALGIASYAGVKVYAAKSSAHRPSETAAKAVSRPAHRALVTSGIAAAPSVLPNPEPDESRVHGDRDSLGTPGAAVAPAGSAKPSSVLEPVATAIGRFEDVESSAPPNTSPTAAVSSAEQAPALVVGAASAAPALPVDPRLAREVASLDLVRASAKHGDAAAALRQLTEFERNYGYAVLRKEAMLVHIDVLLSLARRVEAAAIARQLLLAGAPANQRARLEELVRTPH